MHRFAARPYDRRVFATIAGPYPRLGGPPGDALAMTLADQLEAGLGLVADGRVWRLERDADVGLVVGAWSAAAAVIAQLTAAARAPPPPVKACLVGPLSTAPPPRPWHGGRAARSTAAPRGTP